MGKYVKAKSLKKLISLFTAICMLLAIIPATVSFADSNDVITVANTLDQLEDSTKTTILAELWKYAIQEPTDGKPLTANEAADEIIAVLSSQDVNVIGDGAGKISRAALVILSNKVLEYSSVFKSYYSIAKVYMTNDAVKAVLGLPSTATESDVYQYLLDTAFPVVKVNSANTGFEKVDNFSTVVLAEMDKLEVSDEAKIIGASVISLYTDKFITDANTAITTYGFNVSEVATLLKAYNLCEETVATPTPTTTTKPGGGGGGYIPPSTSAPVTDVPAAVTDAANAADKALDAIANLDIGNAALKAADVISSINNIPTEKLTLEQEIALETKVTALIDAVMNKASQKVLTASVEGTTATANISASDLISIKNTITDIVSAAEKLEAVVNKSKLDVAVERVLTLTATTGSDVKTSNFVIPSDLMETAKDKNIDKITLKTDVASFTLSPKALGDVKEAVTLSAAKIDAAAISAQYKNVVGDNIVVDLTVKVGDKTVTNFSKPITVSIPYTLKAGEDKNKITVFYVKDDGSLENIAGTYNEATKTVVFTTKHFSLYMVKEVDVKFKDVNTSDWFEESVETMAAKGIVKGYEDGSYKPQSKITRAEFAALLVRSFNLSDATAENTFNDVKSSDWFVKDVAAAAKSGIVSGVGNGAFAPGENISRQDMAVMISRALKVVKNKSGVVASTTQDTFKDSSSIADYAQTGVAVAAKYQIIKGLPGGDFGPKNDATRAEAATMISRLFFLE